MGLLDRFRGEKNMPTLGPEIEIPKEQMIWCDNKAFGAQGSNANKVVETIRVYESMPNLNVIPAAMLYEQNLVNRGKAELSGEEAALLCTAIKLNIDIDKYETFNKDALEAEIAGMSKELLVQIENPSTYDLLDVNNRDVVEKAFEAENTAKEAPQDIGEVR
jgi:hypothetical protein